MRASLPIITALALACAAASAARADVRQDGPPLKAPASLDCPDRQGALDLMARAPDGQWCDYETSRGDTVRLSIVPLRGATPTQALAATRARLHALVPVYRDPLPEMRGDEPGERADVDVPFVHVHAIGDRADVRIFGIRINARNDKADVDVSRGHKHSAVHAGLRGAEVVADDVGRTNAELVYVLASSRRQDSGYRAVGYVARGASAGPLVVAEFHNHDRHNDNGRGDHDIDRLLDRNLRR